MIRIRYLTNIKRLVYNKMNNINRKCYLQDLDAHKKINLNHNEVVTLGRNKNTGIQDIFLSKEQLECIANLETCQVKVKQIGRSISLINGLALIKSKTYTVGHGEQLELKIGKYRYEIIFDPCPVEQDFNNEPTPKKAKMNFPLFNMGQAKRNQGNNESASNGRGTWEDIDGRELLIYTSDGCISKCKVASFDIDGTIIKTKSGARFPKNCEDWVFYYDDIVKHLKKLITEDFKIVFFTNQSGVGKDISKIKDFKRKIENIVTALGLPIQVFVALGKSIYRKPMPGMWNKLVEEKNENIDIKVSDSFFVGDAAGREKNWAPKRNKDHSCSDRLFALNIGLKFYTPEEFFLKQRPALYKMPEFDPRILSKASYPDISHDKLNVIIMVGGPGSGKSHFCKEYVIPKGYAYVNRDILGSWQKCVKELEENLENKKNVVIDNTNVDVETRKRFIDAAKKFYADVRCFVMSTSLAQMRHNNKFRELTDKSHAKVNDIIIFSYRKNYKEPDLSEGYTNILQIPFVPKFDCPERETLYKTFLID